MGRLRSFQNSSKSKLLDPLGPELNYGPKCLLRFVHTGSHEKRWISIAHSNPVRVVSALGLYAYTEGTSNEWGDTNKDTYPAIQAVDALASQGGQPWENLVKEGCLDRLCRTALEINIPAYQDNCSDFSPKIRAQIKEARPAPCFLALSPLFKASERINRRPSAIDRQVISALKRNWTQIVERVWMAPETRNVHQNYGTHFSDKATLVTCFMQLALVDGTFLRIIMNDADRTFSLLTRFWIQSATDLHFKVFSNALGRALRAATKIDPAPNVTQRVLDGGDGTPASIFRYHMELVELGVEDEVMAWVVISDVFKQASQECLTRSEDSPCYSFVREMELCAPFWRLTLKYMRPSAVPFVSGKAGPSPAHTTQLSPPEGLLPVVHLFRQIFACLWRHISKAECAEFISNLIQHDFFGVFDDVIQCITSDESGLWMYSEEITKIFVWLQSYCHNGGNLFTSVVAPQFPRPRTFRALLDVAFTPDGEARHKTARPLEVLCELDPEVFPNMLTNSEYIQSAWEAYWKLQELIQDQEKCRLRGCSRAGTHRCASCKVKYCGRVCQKMDWKEHRLSCGFQTVVGAKFSEATAIPRVIMPTKPVKRDIIA